MRGWGNCLKYFKWGWNRTKERRHKDFKKGGGKLGQGMAVLKRGGGAGTPLRTMNRFFRFLLNSFLKFFWLIWLISVQQILPTYAENIIFTKNSC